MRDLITQELGTRGAAAVLAFLLGGLVSWGVERWRRMRQRRSIRLGDARDTVVIEHHIVEMAEAPDPDNPGHTCAAPCTLRVRALGQSPLAEVIPNGHLAAEFLARAWRVTPQHTLISMEGAEGSYLLETLTGFVGDRLGNQPFEHDVYVMAPCCEPRGLANHQPIVILLIAADDLALFNSWEACRGIRVEHGSDGTRVLTLLEMAKRHREDQARLARLRHEARRTLHVETMYALDLALDRSTSPIPTRKVPWGRFAATLKELGLS